MARSYTRQQKTRAVALSYAVGVSEAARRLSIPHRTISAWRAHPDFADAVQQERDQLAEDLRTSVKLALRKVAEGLMDPRSNLGHRARALEVLHKSLALVEGEATERIESANLNVNAGAPVLDDLEKHLLREYIRAIQAGKPVVLAERITEEPDHD